MVQGLETVILLVCLGVIFACLYFGAHRAGTVEPLIRMFSSVETPEAVLRAVLRFALQSGHKVVAIDRSSGKLILQESLSEKGITYSYPISIFKLPGGFAQLAVGVTCKTEGSEANLGCSLYRCVEGIKRSLVADLVPLPSEFMEVDSSESECQPEQLCFHG